MESLAHIWHLGIKELRSLWHDKALLVFVLVAFTVMIYTASSAGSMELHNAPVAVVDEDQTVLSGRVINALQEPWFLPPDIVDYHEVDGLLDNGSHTFALVIPEGFERDVRQGQPVALRMRDT